MRKNVRIVTDNSMRQTLTRVLNKQTTIQDLNLVTDGRYSHNSVLAMSNDWNRFYNFCLSHHVVALPAASTAVRLFLQSESRNRKYASIRRYSVTISLMHRILGYDDPVNTHSVRRLMSELSNEKRGDATSSHAFTKSSLDALTGKLERSNTPIDVRNLAIYHVMFECLLKRSELKSLNVNNVTIESLQGILSLGNEYYRLSKGATDKLNRWLILRGVAPGPLFVAIDKHGRFATAPLDDSSIYRIMRSASDKLGLALDFSGQSLRVGGAFELAKQGIKTREIQTYGRWKSAAMPYYYVGNTVRAAHERLKYKVIRPID